MEVLVKEQVSEAVVRTLQIRCSLIFHRKTSVLESLLNKVAGLKVCSSIKKKLQHRCLPGKFANFLRKPFLQNSFSGYFRGLPRVFKNWCDCNKQILAIINKSNKYHVQRKIRSSHHRYSVKKRPATLLEEGSSIAKFTRTTTLKIVCERLLQKISNPFFKSF